MNKVAMPTQTPDEHEDAPLDPEMEKVRRKMVRLLVVSIGIMFTGLMAVLVAIVYKINETPDQDPARVTTIENSLPAAASDPLSLKVTLPDGFTTNHVALDGHRVLMFGVMPDGQKRGLIIDLASGAVSTDFTITP